MIVNKLKYIIVILCAFLCAQNEVCFEIESNPYQNSPSLGCFSKYIRVLDCFDVYAESTVSDEKVLHVAAVIAELLDNDEDGNVDDLFKNMLNSLKNNNKVRWRNIIILFIEMNTK